jgi:hypothetical protein
MTYVSCCADEISAVGYFTPRCRYIRHYTLHLTPHGNDPRFFYRFDGMMPLSGGCSAVIAAICAKGVESDEAHVLGCGGKGRRKQAPKLRRIHRHLDNMRISEEKLQVSLRRSTTRFMRVTVPDSGCNARTSAQARSPKPKTGRDRWLCSSCGWARVLTDSRPSP